MHSDWMDSLDNRAFAALKWVVTLLTGVLTAAIILILES